MDLTIDGASVDFELERERNLGDVLYSLDQWLDGQGLIISRIELDGNAIDGDIMKVKDKSVDSIVRLGILTESVASYRLRALRSACAWLDGILDRASGSAEETPDGLLEEGDLLLSSSSGFLNPEEISFLELARDSVKEPLKAGPSGTIPRIAEIMRERLSECEDPLGQARKAASDFRLDRESILNIPVWLQTGRDKEAMEAVSRFTDVFSKILRLMPLLAESGVDTSKMLVDGRPHPEFFTKLNEILAELMQAFGARDTVLIGDLAEYEVLPRLESIFAAIEKAIA